MASHRDKALRRVREERPKLLVGSPPCTPFSQWQHINDKKRDPETVKWEKARGEAHLAFCAILCHGQAKEGRYFLHDHPAGASSWGVEPMRRVVRISGTEAVGMHQCQLGGNDGKGKPLKKPTKWLLNSPEILRALDRQCLVRAGDGSWPGVGRHALCNGLVVRRAATYLSRMRKAILQGFRRQLILDGVIRTGSLGMHYVGETTLRTIVRNVKLLVSFTLAVRVLDTGMISRSSLCARIW